MKVILGNGKRRNLKLERCCGEDDDIPIGYSGYSGYSGISDSCRSYKSEEFNGSTDWEGPENGYYTFLFVHNLNTQDLLVEIWEEENIPVKVFPDTLTKLDNNSIEIKVCSFPDRRFAGRIVVAGC